MAALVDGQGAPARTGGADVTDTVECRYHGRDFTAAEMALLRELIAGPPAMSRHALSREFCRRIGWYKADGGLKDMMARVVMLAMHKDGLIELPPPRWRPGRRGPVVFGPDTEPPLLPPPTALDEVRPLQMRTVVRATAGGSCGTSTSPATTTSATRPWSAPRCATPCTRATARRWPCSASPPPPGSSPRATVYRLDAGTAGEEPAARRRQPALPDPALDPYPQPRLAHPRHRRRQLPLDWTARYNTTPVLIETFVETPRYTGAVYRASGWIHVGATQGRGRYDTKKLYDKPKKDIWLRPLRKDWKRILNR